LWDTATGAEVRRFRGHLGKDSRLGGFSPDGKLLAVATGVFSDGSVRLWQVATGEEVRRFDGHQDEVSCLAYAPGGKLVASGSADRTIRLWDPAAGKQLRLLDGHEAEVVSLAFAPDGRTLASLAEDGSTRLWDVADGRQLARLENAGRDVGNFRAEQDQGSAALAFSSDGKTLVAVGRNGAVTTWNVAARKEIQRRLLAQKDTFHRYTALLPDGQTVLTGGDAAFRLGADAAPETLCVWDLTTGKVIQELPLRKAHQQNTRIVCSAIAVSPDSGLFSSSQKQEIWAIRTSYRDPSLRLWERLSGQEVLCIKDTLSRALAFAPNGRLLAADAGNASNFGRIGTYGFGSSINLWDTLTGKAQAKLAGHTAPVRCLAFAPNGKTLASGSADHTILIWKTPALKPTLLVADPDAQQLQRWWEELASADAKVAHQALAQLVLHPGPAARLLHAKLKPAGPVAPEKISALVKDLDSSQYKVRQKAFIQLQKLEELAEAALRKAQASAPSEEARVRLTALLEKLATPTRRQQRALRAVTALERIGSPEARQVLATLARGVPGAQVTWRARLALQRLNGEGTDSKD
jgi:WD40 repeat protein